MATAGLVLAVLAELSWFGMIVEPAQLLLPSAVPDRWEVAFWLMVRNVSTATGVTAPPVVKMPSSR